MKKFLVAILSLLLVTLIVGCDKKNFEVVFKDGETILETQTIAKDGLVVQPADPSKESTEQYSYTFDGWYNGETKWDFANDKVTQNITLDAKYTEKVRSYTVTFKDEDGTVLSTVSVEYNGTVEKPADPIKESTATNSFVFDAWYNGETKWDFATKVKGDISLVAKYTTIEKSYTVKFVDEDGTVLDSKLVAENKTVTAPENPTKESTAQYDYAFDGWYNGETKFDLATLVNADLTLTAKYTETLRKYTVKFVDEDGTVLKEENLEYGSKVVAPANPTKESTAENVYTFDGWDKEIADVTGEATYTAKYKEEKRKYEITFMLDNETEIETISVAYGQVPSCSVEPSKTGEGVKYVFTGWDKELAAVTGDATYTAVFEEYRFGMGNVETFEENISLNDEKHISGYYDYSSTSKSVAPIIIENGKLVFNVLDTTGFQGLSINFGSVEAGKSYLINLDMEVLKADGTDCFDGFAYALTSKEGATASSAGGLLTNFELIKKQGKFVYLYQATEDLDNLYLVIRSQKDTNYIESKLVIDNVICEETDIVIKNSNTLETGALNAEFNKGFVVSEGKGTRYHGDVTVFTPNLNSSLEVVSGENAALRLNHSFDNQKGLYGIKVEGIVAGGIYEVSMDIDMFDADGNNVNASEDTYFEAMVYMNNDTFSGNRYKLYDSENKEYGVNTPIQKFIVEGNTVKFSFVASEEGYVVVTLRSLNGKGLVYADLSKFSIAPLDSVKVTFKNGDEEVQKGNILKGSVPAYKGEAIVKEADSEYTYEFLGWSLDGETVLDKFDAVTEDTTYIAVFGKTAIEYTINVKFAYDDTLNQEVKFTTLTKDAKLAEIKAMVPANDAQYTYTSNIPAELTLADNEYTIDRSVNKYEVIFQNHDETVLERKELEYGTMPICSVIPTKEGFSFIGWSPEISSVVANAVYTAQYEEIKPEYEVIFKNHDGSELYKETLEVNVVPEYKGETPVRDADTEYTYQFLGWSLDGETLVPELAPITAKTEYIAVYSKTANEYKVIYYLEDSEVYQEVPVKFGDAFELIEAPSKTGYNGSWTGETFETMPAHNVSYTISYSIATYKATIIYGDNFPELENKTVEFTIENRDSKLAEIKALTKCDDIRFTYEWSEALPTELECADVEFTLIRNFDDNVETFETATLNAANKAVDGAKWSIGYSSSIMPLDVVSLYHPENGSGKTLLWKFCSSTAYGSMNINIGSVFGGVEYTVIFDMKASVATNSTGGQVPNTSDFTTPLTQLAFGAGAENSTSGSVVNFAIAKDGIVKYTFTPANDAENYYLVFRNQKNTAGWVLIDNFYVKAKELSDEQVATAAINSLSFDSELVADSNVDLTTSYTFANKTASISYEVTEGSSYASISNNQLVLGKPTATTTIKVKATATCGEISSEKEFTMSLVVSETLLSLTETFEAGSVDANGANYKGGNIDAKRPNTNTTLSIVEHENSKALKVERNSATATQAGYVGFYSVVKPNTTYVVSLDLDAIGSTTGEMASVGYVQFEVYNNAAIGTSANRLYIYNTVGRELSTFQKVSMFAESNGSYKVIFTTNEVSGDNYIYFTIKISTEITGAKLSEDVTVYVDNLKIQECQTVLNDDFETGTATNNVYTGETKGIRVGTNSTISVGTYNDSKVLQAICLSGKQGFLGFKVEVEAGKTYRAIFEYDLIGASGTSYNTGTSGGNCATMMLSVNTEALNDGNSRLNFNTTKQGTSLNNTPAVNMTNSANNPYHAISFTANADGYVYIVLRTNNIAEDSYIYIDNLHVACLSD